MPGISVKVRDLTINDAVALAHLSNPEHQMIGGIAWEDQLSGVLGLFDSPHFRAVGALREDTGDLMLAIAKHTLGSQLHFVYHLPTERTFAANQVALTSYLGQLIPAITNSQLSLHLKLQRLPNLLRVPRLTDNAVSPLHAVVAEGLHSCRLGLKSQRDFLAIPDTEIDSAVLGTLREDLWG